MYRPEGDSPTRLVVEVGANGRRKAEFFDLRVVKEPPSDGNVDTLAVTKISVRKLNFYYGAHQALIDNNIDILANRVTGHSWRLLG